MPLGQGEYTYDYHADWAGLETAYHEGWVPAVACATLPSRRLLFFPDAAPTSASESASEFKGVSL